MAFAKGNTVGKKTRFKKGEVNNPNGRPKGKHFKTLLKKFIAKNITYKNLQNKPENMPITDALAMALIAKALYGGDIAAIRLLMEHVDLDLNLKALLRYNRTPRVTDKIKENLSRKT